MSVTSARGFRASGITAGIKASGNPDLALVVNDGPAFHAAGVFTSNRVKAAPVLWSQQVLRGGQLSAVVLNSGGANACTGPEGFQDTHRTAEATAELLGASAAEIAVCSTGLIGVRLPMDALLPGLKTAADALDADGGPAAATAIMTTDSVSKTAEARGTGYVVGGMAKGAGMLAPGLATMLVVLTTDAAVDAAGLDDALRAATRVTFDRVDSDGCMSTNDTVLLLASGASGDRPRPGGVPGRGHRGLREPGPPARRRRRGRHQGHRRRGRRRRHRGRRRRGRQGRDPQQPVQVRHVRQRPQLGPHPVRRRHHAAPRSSPGGSPSPSTACGSAATAASGTTGTWSTSPAARCASWSTWPPASRPRPCGPTT